MSRILVIEDEPNLRKNILDFLELEGFEVLEASDGQIGVETARQYKPDLIISDISMPNMDGYNALLELRKDQPSAHIPIIFLSAMADRSFVRHGMELGADDYLTKPFNPAYVRSRVREWLLRKRVETPEGYRRGLCLPPLNPGGITNAAIVA